MVQSLIFQVSEISPQYFNFINKYQEESVLNQQNKQEILNDIDCSNLTYNIFYHHSQLERQKPDNDDTDENDDIDDFYPDIDTLKLSNNYWLKDNREENFNSKKYAIQETQSKICSIEICDIPIKDNVSGKINLVQEWLIEDGEISQNSLTVKLKEKLENKESDAKINENIQENKKSENLIAKINENIQENKDNENLELNQQESLNNYSIEQQLNTSGRADLVVNWLQQKQSLDFNDTLNETPTSFNVSGKNNLIKEFLRKEGKISQYPLTIKPQEIRENKESLNQINDEKPLSVNPSVKNNLIQDSLREDGEVSEYSLTIKPQEKIEKKESLNQINDNVQETKNYENVWQNQQESLNDYWIEQQLKISGRIDLITNGLKQEQLLDFNHGLIAQFSLPLGTPQNLPQFDQQKIEQYQIQPADKQKSQPENKNQSTPEKSEKESTEIDEKSEKEVREELINFLLNNAAQKYPNIVNTTDAIIIKPNQYKPQDFNFYTDFELRFDGNIIKLNEQIPIITYWNFSKFNDGFYWILDGNKMVIETTGIHGGLSYQGFSSKTNYEQIAKGGTTFWGVQTAWAFPPVIGNLIGEAERESAEQTNITILSLEVINPKEAKIDEYSVTFTGIIPGSDIAISFDDISKAETYSPEGGGAFFENLDADNAPVFLQGFKTVNLKPLLDHGVELKAGEIIPEENLKKAGLVWGDFFTGEGFSFTPNTDPLTQKKFPKLQRLRLGDDVNNDLVSLLSNPFLSEREREVAYLNALDWINFGPQNIQIQNFNETTIENDWYRFTISHSHNRSLLYYHPEKIEINYTNVFANPGLSLTLTSLNEIETRQTINTSIGNILGVIFEFINPNNLDESLDEAKEINANLKPISSLKTKATSPQRRAMNTRLNLTLGNTENVNSLSQVSGSWTFASKITPEDSLLFQFKTGLYQRSVQFYQQKTSEWSQESPTIFFTVRDIDLFPITFSSVNIPIFKTDIEEPKNVFQTVSLIISTPEDIIIRNLATITPIPFSSVPFPNPQHPAEIEFGLLELARFRNRLVEESSYLGKIYLPAIEFLLSGTKNNFNYGFSTTLWYNPTPNSAPNVENNATNIIGISQEHSLGVAVNSYADLVIRNFYNFDEQKRPRLSIIQVPSLSLTLNSSPNRLNTSSATLGYLFILRTPDFGFSLSNNLIYTPQGINALVNQTNQGEFGIFFICSFFTQSGLNTRFYLEFGTQIFTNLSATYTVINNPKFGQLSLGAYYRNFTSLTRGLGTRISDSAYGGIIDYIHPYTNFNINAELGVNERGFDGKLRMGLKMKF